MKPKASNEHWRPAPNWEDLYEVSDQGRVRRTGLDALGRRRYVGHILQPVKTTTGYFKHTLCREGHQANVMVHILVAAAFLGPRPPGKQCNHKNYDKLDNRTCNLEYVTASENYRHALANGHRPVEGMAHWNAKLTDADVRAIKKLRSEGFLLKDIAVRFGVTPATVSRILNGVWWKHVD